MCLLQQRFLLSRPGAARLVSHNGRQFHYVFRHNEKPEYFRFSKSTSFEQLEVLLPDKQA